MSERYDVIVIGSGIGGLTAALTCARQKRSVLVLEAGKQFGGYLNPFARKHFHFDPGVHYIGECGPGGVFSGLMEDLGLDLRFVPMDDDGIDNYVFPNYEVKSCVGLDRYRDQLAKDFPRERAALHRFFRLLHDFNRVFREARKVGGFRGVVHALPGIPSIARFARATLAECLDAYFEDRTLKAVLAAPCGDLGLPPSRLSALMHIGVVTHYAGGAYVPAGGSGVVRDAFVAALEQEGAVLKRNTRVEAILHTNGRVTGVRTASGDTYQASRVISNAQASATYEMVGLSHLQPRLRHKLQRVEHSVGSLTLYLGVDGALDTRRVGRMNVWNYDSVDIERMYTEEALNDYRKNGSFFLSVPSNKDPEGGLAPAGKQTVELVALCGPKPFAPWFGKKTMKRGEDYEALKDEIAEHFITQAERYLPGLRQHIVLREVGTPATNISFANTPDGNIYGPAHSLGQTVPFRFAVRSPVKGLFLSGASVMCAGVIPCALSGRQAGGAALASLGRRSVASVGKARVVSPAARVSDGV